MTVQVEHALAVGCVLGEGPVWDAERACVWFVDIKLQRLHRFDPASGEHFDFEAPDQIGWVLPTVDGPLLAGLKSGLHVFDVSLTEWSHLGPIVGEPVENRLNDACVDPAGRVYFGSMDDGEEVASGRFYRFSRGIVEPFGPAGICITNGPAVSADGKRIYFTDTLGKKILTAAITADGGLGPIKLFVDTVRDFPEAYPDGPVCDAQGGVWTGLWNGWGVAHYAADGSLIEKIDLPVANITKLAFGGRDLNRLFVTTARKGLDPAALAAQPMAGDLFSFDSAVQGVVSARVQLG